MNEEKARELLDGFIEDDDSLYNGGCYVNWNKGSQEITLDDTFDIDFLEAVVWWVRNQQSNGKQ